MPQKFKAGDLVRQAPPPPVTGMVIGYALDQINGDVLFHVAWKIKDGDGHEHVASRYFTAEQLVSAKEAKP